MLNQLSIKTFKVMQSICCNHYWVSIITCYFGEISKASNAPSEGSIKQGKELVDGGGLNLKTGS